MDAESIATGTKVTVEIPFGDTFTGTVDDVETYNGEVSYLISSTAGWQDWFSAEFVTAH